MSNRKFFDSGDEWQKFRESQAKRFGMTPAEFATFFKLYPFSVRGHNLDRGYGILLTGKAEIAAFLGITVKTLETWRKSTKFADLPIRWGMPASYAITDFLLLWKLETEISKMPEGLKRTAIAYEMGITTPELRNFIPVTKRTFYEKHYSDKRILDAAYLLARRRGLKSHIEEIKYEMKNEK
jgi:hypothetical protein